MAPHAVAETTISCTITQPRPWSATDPYLYDVVVTVMCGTMDPDVTALRYGIRTVATSPREGLLINGTPVLLRGACIHHDNGVLGAREYREAAARRIRILKENGYNAIRSSHNPASSAILDECDRQGMYVINEFTDMWTRHKLAGDYASDFVHNWKHDLKDMVMHSCNHPSIVAWSVGNEIAETSRPDGIALNRTLVEHCHRLDPSRPVTNAINFLFNVVGPERVSAATGDAADPQSNTQDRKTKEPSGAGVAALNHLMSAMEKLVRIATNGFLGDRSTRDVFADLDIAGYNYGSGRYRKDARRYPRRIILGSETYPDDIVTNWNIAKSIPQVIGDFQWAGWDYIGEAGLAVTDRSSEHGGLLSFPARFAGCPLIDITGFSQPLTHLNAIAWGFEHGPYLAVVPPASPQGTTRWRNQELVRSWTWPVPEGTPLTVTAFSRGSRIVFRANGKIVCERAIRRSDHHRIQVSIPYSFGELVATSYGANGREIGRDTLVRCGSQTKLVLRQEDRLTEDSITFVAIRFEDENGRVRTDGDQRVTLTIDGPGRILGAGSAQPISPEGFTSNAFTTYRGRGIAVVEIQESQEPTTLIAAAANGASFSLVLR